MQKLGKAKEKIIEYIKAQSGIFNSTSAKHYIKTETGMDASKQIIASFISNSLGRSYKRVSSRSSISNIPQIKLKKIIFWLESMNIVKPDHIVVNIDGTLFQAQQK